MNTLTEHHAYPKDSAGRLMVTEIPTVGENATVGDIEQLLIKDAGNFETINYIYITDSHKKLKGAVSVKELFRSPKNKRVIELSPEKLVTARAHTDQERIALFAVKHNIKAIPVVTKDDELLGVVPSDVILDVLHSENIEDILRMAGSGTFEDPVAGLTKAGALTHFGKRLPWLVVGLLGGVLAAFIVSFFEGLFVEQLALVAFIPAVVYIADAVGAQTQMIFIRAIALEHAFNIREYMWREVKVNTFLAITLGAIIYFISFAWLKSMSLSLVLGLSIVATVLVSMLIAIALPWFLQKAKQDPAIASGPPATVARDITSLVIYFAIAMLLV